MSIINKLFEIQQLNLSVKKDGKNPHFKNEYITLDKLISKLQPICNEQWLLIIHKTIDGQVITSIIDTKSGEDASSYFPLWDTTNPQKVGSAITYAKRYNLCQIFNIISDRDDDANIASIKDVAVKTPFTNEDMKKLSENNLFKNSAEAIKAIWIKRILTDTDKEAITFLFTLWL